MSIDPLPEEVESESSFERDPLEQLAEEFVERRRRGENVSITEYAQGHPELATRIRELFPTLVLMEECKQVRELTSSVVPSVKRLERLGDFRILREIGRGGMGVVYEAEQESLSRHVALKVLPSSCLASPTRLQRFLHEAQAAARLHHTNIVPVFGVGEQDDLHYFVMQYIPGQSLDSVVDALSHPDGLASGRPTPPSESKTISQDLHAWSDTASHGLHSASTWDQPIAIRQKGQGDASDGSVAAFGTSDAARMLLSGLSFSDAVASSSETIRPSEPAAPIFTGPRDGRYWRSVARIGVQVADALEYAHRQGILHRDIKPSNLLLDPGGTVWVTDFGLAKSADLDNLTHSGDMVGTLRYMAPERFAGKADARSDVYSLGLTLYELLALRPAFDETDRGLLIHQVTQEEPPRLRKLDPAIPRDLETIVVKAISSQPSQRYPSAGELAADLRCYLEDRLIRARRATLVARTWRWCRRNRAVAALGAAAMLLLVAVAVVASVGYARTHQALARAEVERTRTKAQRERAEKNVHLATKAFEEIFSKIISDSVAEPSQQGEDDDWPDPVWETVVSDRDAAVLESMLKFYDQFAEQNDSDVKLRKETARAYRRVGDIQRRLGQYAKAETAYRHALTVYQRLADASPESLNAVATINNELGVVLRYAGQFIKARDAHLAALDALRKEPAKTAALPESRFALAQTYGYLVAVARARVPGRPIGPGGRPPGGGWRFGRPGNRPGGGPDGPPPDGRGGEPGGPPPEGFGGESGGRRGDGPGGPFREPLAGDDRSDRPRGGRDHHDGRNKEAIQYHREAREILQKLIEEAPDNPRYRLAMAQCERDGTMLGPHEDNLRARREAIRILEELVAKSPQNPDYRYELAETYAMGYPRFPGNDESETAVKQLRLAVAIGGDLTAQYPKVPEYKALAARCCQRLADSLGRTNQAEVEDLLSKTVKFESELADELSAIPTYRLFLARSQQRLANLQAANQKLPQARASLEASIANLKKLPESATDARMVSMMQAEEYTHLARLLKQQGDSAAADQASAKAKAIYEALGPGLRRQGGPNRDDSRPRAEERVKKIDKEIRRKADKEMRRGGDKEPGNGGGKEQGE